MKHANGKKKRIESNYNVLIEKLPVYRWNEKKKTKTKPNTNTKKKKNYV